MGKHRTEVTEVTERGLEVGGKTACRDITASGARNTPKGKASHRGHGGHRGGSKVGGKTACRGYHRSGARNTPKGKASHRGHIGHGEAIGDWGGWVECANGDNVGLGKKTTGVRPSAYFGVSVFLCVAVFFQLTIAALPGSPPWALSGTAVNLCLFLAPQPNRRRHKFRPPTSIPLCGLCDLCAMLSR
jgi:hypothetical protein